MAEASPSKPCVQRSKPRLIATWSPLHFWARVAETIVPPLRQLKPTALVAEFRRQVAIELDLRRGAWHSEIAALHEDDPRMVVPTVDWDATNATVLTMSREMGIPIDEREDLIDAGLDVTEVLTQAATLFFKGVFELGVFHGDQHAAICLSKRTDACFSSILALLDASTENPLFPR